MKSILQRLLKGPPPTEWLASLPKLTSWESEGLEKLHRWIQDPRAQENDIPEHAIAKGVSLNQGYWDIISRWWTRYPKQFALFWKYLEKNPRQPWSPSCLNTLDKHSTDKTKVINLALLNDEGRFWLLNHATYFKHLENLSDVVLRDWTYSTIHSMQKTQDSFHTLYLLTKKCHIDPERTAAALTDVFLSMEHPTQEQANGHKQLSYKAWPLSNQELDHWMDEDKTLPWWFDPVNRHTWVQEFKEWSREVRWTPPPESPLFVYF